MRSLALWKLLVLLAAASLLVACSDDDDMTPPSGETSETGPSGTDGPGTDGPGTDGPGTDGPGTDGPGTDGPGTDGPGTDGPGTDGPGTDGPGTDEPSTALGTIADIVAGLASADEPEFTALLAAIQAADPDILAALSDEDSTLTVFAPTDAAFAAALTALGYADLDALVADEDVDLDEVLQYHVLGAIVESEDVASGPVMPLAGGLLWVIADDSGISFNGTDVAVTELFDVPASNGVIHVIDGVLLPLPTIGEAAQEEGFAFGSLAAALGQAGLVATFEGEGPFTVFAPTDDAFADFLDGTELTAVPNDVLTEVLTYHVLEDALASFGFTSPLLQTLSGYSAWIDLDELTINDAGIIAESIDIFFSNGVVHAIDEVITPRTTVEFATLAGLDLLLAAVTYAEIAPAVAELEDATIFAPTDDAFVAFLDGDELTDFTPEEIADVLLFHVHTEAAIFSSTILEATANIDLEMANESTATVDITELEIAGAPLIPALLDIVVKGDDGDGDDVVIHVIGAVMADD